MNEVFTAQNNDRELWREREGDYYADSIHVTEHGAIGINCGGHVIVKRLADWHESARLAAIARSLSSDLARLQQWHVETADAPAEPISGEKGPLVTNPEGKLNPPFTSGQTGHGSRLERYKTALQSIAANSCCQRCREAALVAEAALRV